MKKDPVDTLRERASKVADHYGLTSSEVIDRYNEVVKEKNTPGEPYMASAYMTQEELKSVWKKVEMHFKKSVIAP